MIDLMNDPYLSRRGIEEFFGISRKDAKRLYAEADKVDAAELVPFRLKTDRVRKSTACRLQHITVEEAKKNYAERCTRAIPQHD